MTCSWSIPQIRVGLLALCIFLFSWPQGLSGNRVQHQADKPLGCTALGMLNCPKGAVSTCTGCQRKSHFNISISDSSNAAWPKELPAFPRTAVFIVCLPCILNTEALLRSVDQAGFKLSEPREAHVDGSRCRTACKVHSCARAALLHVVARLVPIRKYPATLLLFLHMPTLYARHLDTPIPALFPCVPALSFGGPLPSLPPAAFPALPLTLFLGCTDTVRISHRFPNTARHPGS